MTEQERIEQIGRAAPQGVAGAPRYLRELDFSILQQCIHCGMCLPTCPTYDATKLERNSPRGRIALMRQIAEGAMPVTEAFGREMYFCLGCLTCETVCPAGVAYAPMFEAARGDIEQAGVLATPSRTVLRWLTLRVLFTHPWLLRAVGRGLRWYQASGLEAAVRASGLLRLLPRRWRELEPLTPRVRRDFSDALIAEREGPIPARYRVGLLTGCVQDLIYPEVNRDTLEVLVANGCEVITPRAQACCGSLHAHNGELETAREMARRNIREMEAAAGPLTLLDAIISNAAGCGSHLKHYDHLLAGDPAYRERAAAWSARVKDVQEWLAATGIRVPTSPPRPQRVTYHEACHLCHGQKISSAPRTVLAAVPGLELIELREATWCCGSAGVYNITQPEMSHRLQRRKLEHLQATGAEIVASANPGCSVQLAAGLRESGSAMAVAHPVSLLAEAYRAEQRELSAAVAVPRADLPGSAPA